MCVCGCVCVYVCVQPGLRSISMSVFTKTQFNEQISDQQVTQGLGNATEEMIQ